MCGRASSVQGGEVVGKRRAGRKRVLIGRIVTCQQDLPETTRVSIGSRIVPALFGKVLKIFAQKSSERSTEHQKLDMPRLRPIAAHDFKMVGNNNLGAMASLKSHSTALAK